MLEHSLINRKKNNWILSRICCADTNFYAGFVLLSLSLEVFKNPEVDVALGHMVNGEHSSAGLMTGPRLQVHLQIPACDLLDSLWF